MIIIKKPIAWLPIAISLLALTIMLIFIAMSGPPARQADEGTGAHLFQIWLTSELLMMTFFGFKYLPKEPKQALGILAIQIIAVVAACSPVFYFKL